MNWRSLVLRKTNNGQTRINWRNLAVIITTIGFIALSFGTHYYLQNVGYPEWWELLGVLVLEWLLWLTVAYFVLEWEMTSTPKV